MRKLIGIIIGDPCGSYQRGFLEGALKVLFNNDIDAAVFSTFGKRSMSHENKAGESVRKDSRPIHIKTADEPLLRH